MKNINYSFSRTAADIYSVSVGVDGCHRAADCFDLPPFDSLWQTRADRISTVLIA